jgi:hypothetical protein
LIPSGNESSFSCEKLDELPRSGFAATVCADSCVELFTFHVSGNGLIVKSSTAMELLSDKMGKRVRVSM